MNHVENFHFQTSPSRPRIGFERQGGSGWKEWDRYLTIDGKRAYHIGNICGTCQFLFSKMENANRSFSATAISKRLEESSDLADSKFLSFVSEILPADDYFVSQIRLNLHLVNPGDKTDYFSAECVELFGIDGYYGVPHNPQTPYYRDSGTKLKDSILLTNFVVPLHQPGTLDNERVGYYLQRLTTAKTPTALAISVLDIKAPALIRGEPHPQIKEHWCLAHYLLDGHHKIHAASKAKTECSVLCFLSRKESFGGENEFYDLSKAISQ